MEVIGLVMGFFVSKKIEDPDELFFQIKQELDIPFVKTYSFGTMQKDIKINVGDGGDLSNLTLLEASYDYIKITIHPEKILIIFNGNGEKNIDSFFNKINPLTNKVFEFMKEKHKIVRMGMISRLFLKPKNNLSYLSQFLNLDKFPSQDFFDINLIINSKGEINNILTNNYIMLSKAEKKLKRKKEEGIRVNIDVNNHKDRELKNTELDEFFDALKKEVLRLSKEKSNER